MAKNTYDENSIEVLEGLECVRKKPAMYIGDLSNGVFHILKEVLDNALDEAMNGYSDSVNCKITNDYIEVSDTGRGIPVGKIKGQNKSALEVIMTKLHAGGKISNSSAYAKGSVGCFTGDTVIRLADGSYPTIEELWNMYEMDHNNVKVYSKSKFVNVVSTNECYGVYRTKQVTELIKIILDNCQVIKCTVDHPFIKSDGTYIKAADIQVGECLCGMYGDSPVINTDKKTNESNLTNYRVLGIEHKFVDPTWVYGMSVDVDHNYLLGAGVFVSNTHGVGVSCTNALSDWFKVFTYRDKKWWSQTYSKGIPTTEVIKENPGGNYSKGTIVRFIPDKTILKNDLNESQVRDWMETSSFLNPDIAFSFTGKDNNKVEFKSKGLSDYINKLTNDSYEAIKEPFVIKTDNVDLILQWFETDKTDVKSWCNSSLTIEGGTHLNTIYQMITKEFSEYAKKKDFKAEDLRAGLFGAINIKIQSPQFDSQTKEKLISPEAVNLINTQVLEPFKKYLKKDKAFVKKILTRASELRGIYNKFNQEKKALSKLKTRGKLNLPPAAKFAVSNTKNPSERELYIVEGLSAGGTAKAARNPAFQEILMLKGKILNTERKNMSTAFESDDVLNILKGIGFDPDSKEHCLRVGKIIILTDADVDGCLDGDTRVLTLDGKNPTIKELAEEWKKNPIPFQVYSTTADGNIEIAEAINPRKTRTVNEYIELEFSDGEKIKCTLDHKWLLHNPYKYDPKVIWDGEYGYKLAKDISHVDIIAGISISEKCPFSKFLKNKRVINETKDVYCLTVPKYHNFMVSDSNNGVGICSSNSHISTLLLTLFQNLYPEVLEKNMVYVVDAPLFIGKTKTSEIYAESLEELKTLAEKAGKKLETVTRAKGWGEINAPLLRKLAFDKTTRKIKLITASTGDNLKMFKQIVGDDVTLRKKILSEI